MKVVFDTNIFISAFVITNGEAEKAVLKIVNRADILLISKDILDETLTVLARKFGYDREALSHTAVLLSEIAEIIKPSIRINILKDEPDNKILECAVAGNAGIIVTGDKEMLKLGEYKDIKIISLKEYNAR